MDRPDPVNARCRQLPAVDRLVESAARSASGARWSLLAAARAVVESARADILSGQPASHDPDLETLSARTRTLAARLELASPRRVLNATGVVIHTNLGRAPLSEGALRDIGRAAAGYSDLELDLAKGIRGSRTAHVAELLTLLSGAEAAHVVNNNAAALMLAVDTLAAGREVILSRGELVEIGGSFRLPEILGASRARIHEVGTTNRTHLRDYVEAIGPETGLILKVHRSCFEMRGFTAEVPLRELAPLAAEHGVPLVEDRGSGTFLDLRPHGIPEDSVSSGLDEGANLVLFSGDKLLGGPQAGIILGGAPLVAKLARAPLARALRIDKLTLSALTWTLKTLLEGRGGEEIPVLRMLLAGPDELRSRAERLVKELSQKGFTRISLESQGAVVGGGTLPELELAGPVVRVALEGSVSEFARRLRDGDPPLLIRVQGDALLIDPRTLLDEDLSLVVAAFVGASH